MLEDYPSCLSFGASQSMGRGRCCAEMPMREPPLLISFESQRWYDFGFNFKFGHIWTHWHYGAGDLGSLDARTSHPPHNDGGQLDEVSMHVNVFSNQERLDSLSWPNRKEGGNEVPKHQCPVPDTTRLVKTSLRGWQSEDMTSRRHVLHSSWWSFWMHWGSSDVSECLGFHLNSNPVPADCSPVIVHANVTTGRNWGDSWATESVGFTFERSMPEEISSC